MRKNNHPILPPKTIGIIGGGQLGRMMAIAARYMGYQIAVLDPTPNCPTAQVADKQIVAAYDDMDAVKELTELSDVVTYEFENVDLTAATYIEKEGKLPQGAYALEVTQNREKEKELMKSVGLPVPEFKIVQTESDIKEAFETIAFPAVIKTCRGGYDGKGQLKIDADSEIEQAVKFLNENKHCIIESWLSFDKEISVVFTRSLSGEITFFPIPENEHKDHILYKSTVPAQISDRVKEAAVVAAKRLADEMNVVGTFAIEMFVDGEDIYINEMAPRPHNSGHYTIEACTISQFAQHIRAICGLPLREINLSHYSVMVNILGEDLDGVHQAMSSQSNGFIHLYGKDAAKPKRKMGHVTFIGESLQQVEQQINEFQEAKQ
ncbi:5-(carboxyamino)imidazole ribonucleotide synthase [Virgibacillus sp. MSJ-26]|uniref:5-(carboxyamino)imidazole ribonucleotide synthase n=1 Tax=Virgibacillus sp. MSJ-26 TaxID=2841522 RepID=UPI001C0FC612|nr:5-(carboxyamino)imidazole ribonucleotide synthase [Virgibacillus sp. MSJ-26]MBU5467947.1 5-(carboxyamino)imidazole ribonucleotide synthase [Virgibacillus sp. MSJ-26]